jgi:hypothetical protein
MAIASATENDMQSLIVRPSLFLLAVPFTRMHLPFIPQIFSDVSFGFMSRLGIFFGLIILLWHQDLRREFFHWRSALFLVASVVSACGAYASIMVVHDHFLIPAITITGAILLALSQKITLGCSWNQVIAAVILAPGIFYLVTYGADLFHNGSDLTANFMPYYWQAGYLLGMFVIPDLFRRRPLLLPAVH